MRKGFQSLRWMPVKTGITLLLASAFPILSTSFARAMPSIDRSSVQTSPASSSQQTLLGLVIPNLPPLGDADSFLPEPKPITNLVISLTDRKVYVYREGELFAQYPIAIGRQGWETPTGEFAVLQMQQNPTWQHPFTGELVPPGPENPLGSRWIGFWTDGINYIGFHGTPNAETVGQAASHGCIRMYDQDVVALFNLVEVGTRVEVRP